MYPRPLVPAALALGAALTALAAPPTHAQRPALLASDAADAASPREALGVRAVDVDVRVVGAFAETTLTLAFHNPHPRTLEGDLFVPLPPGATVAGYALDVGDQLVDGVVVDRAHAQRAYDTELRRGAKRVRPIDPGLVTWTRGNVFTTRVYPIFPGTERTVRLRWVAPLRLEPGGAVLELPLDFPDPLERARVTVTFSDPAARPELLGATPRILAFDHARLARIDVHDAPLVEDLRFRIPDADQQPVVAEANPGGPTYFAIRAYADAPDHAAPRPDAPDPRRIRLVWDASRSRHASDLARERAVIRAYLASLTRPATVDLVVLRDALAPAHAFAIPGQLDALDAALASLPLDGGTRLASLAPPRAPRPDLVLLATDGLATYGPGAEPSADAPTFILTSAQVAGHDALARLAAATGGLHVDLRRLTDAEAIARIGRPAWSLLRVVVESGRVADLLPANPAPVSADGPVVAGRLDSPRATLRLEWGLPGQAAALVQRYEVRADRATPGDTLRVVWANLRLGALLAAPAVDRAAVVALGQEHGLVTPYTSLLVLETLEQYVTWDIRPPAMLRDLRASWDAARVASADRAAAAAAWAPALRARLLMNWEFDQLIHQPDLAGLPALPEAPPWRLGSRVIACERRLQELTRGGLVETLDAPSAGAAPPPPPVVAAVLQPSPDPAALPARTCAEAIGAARPGRREAAYLRHVRTAGPSVLGFLDCADGFVAARDLAMAVRALSNLAELRLDDVRALRVLGHRLRQLDVHDGAIAAFEAVLALRPDEPQSHRDLGLAYVGRAQASRGDAARADWQAAMDHLAAVVEPSDAARLWIQLPTLRELNRYWPDARRAGVSTYPAHPAFERPPQGLDLYAVVTWDTDLTELFFEPETAARYYAGTSPEYTDGFDGYGPRALSLVKGPPGPYRLSVAFARSTNPRLSGPVVAHVDVFTHWGRPNERRRSFTLRLEEGQKVALPPIHL